MTGGMPTKERFKPYPPGYFDIDIAEVRTDHPWTNDRVERPNPTGKKATVKRSRDRTHGYLKQRLHAFLTADNVAKRLKTLKGLTPYECSVSAGKKS